MATIIRFKRGKKETWEKLNILLHCGEAGVEIDTNRFKIGDGVTRWNDLQYQDQNSVYSANTKKDFPKEGNSYTIYKASNESRLYQWNDSSKAYEVLSTGGGGSGEGPSIFDIQIIHGGNANGN